VTTMTCIPRLMVFEKMSMGCFSTDKDYAEVVEFFKVRGHLHRAFAVVYLENQDKDTSKYNLSLAQTLDSIRAKTAFIEVCIWRG